MYPEFQVALLIYSVCIYVCSYSYSYPCVHVAHYNICMLNKNTLGIKSARPIKSSISNGSCNQKLYLPYMLYLSYYFQPKVNINFVNECMYLRKVIMLQVDSCHNMDPQQMICRYILNHSVAKNCRLEFFKIK